MIDEDELVARIAEDLGAGDREAARRALVATLEALGGAVDPVEAEELAGELPARLAGAVRRAAYGAASHSAEPWAALAVEADLPPGQAAEYATVVCRRIAERVGADVLRLLGRRLPSPWRELLQRRGASAPSPAVHHAPVGEAHTLASGRPGSRHDVAAHGRESAQAHSVAREDNPHGDAKLSSGG